MKMTKEQVKETVQALVMDYKKNGNEQAASDAFQILVDHEWSFAKKRTTASKLGGSIDDAISLYGERFTVALQKYEPQEPFVHFINKYIAYAERDAGLKVKRINEHELREGASTDRKVRKPSDLKKAVVGEHTFHEPTNFDDALELTAEEKEARQKEVVAAILEQANEFEIECATLYAEMQSYRKVGDALGVNRMKVQRTLAKVARYYDADRFGDIHDIFTVTTTKSR